MQEQNTILWGLVCRRQCRVPTLRGWLVMTAAVLVLVIVAALEINPFLAVTDKLPGGVLVVEGWAPDYALQAASEEFKQNHYEKIYVTGGPIDRGARFSEYRTDAELGAAILVKLGLSTNAVQAVPAPRVRQDRTYTSAVSLKSWWREHHLSPATVNILTVGPHARRSRLLFEKALGKGVAVGVISIEDDEFEMAHWWRSSAGVRTVIGEALAYGYARLLFYPPKT